MNKPIIQLENVSCTFYIRKGRLCMKKVEALSDITLNLFEGQTLGLVGHNGAGKSTLMQMFAKILEPSSGKITYAPNLRTALLSLQLGFNNELSGLENAILGAMYLGYTYKEAKARLERILDFAELADFAHDPVRTYSSGMKARLGFAVALEAQADVLLIDEILSVGDAYFQHKSSTSLLEKMQQGQTVVIVSHDSGLLKNLCTEVAWLEQGRLRMYGEPNTVIAAYNAWVKDLSNDNKS